jgi:uncharacterized protein YjiS (DUF1127 family)
MTQHVEARRWHTEHKQRSEAREPVRQARGWRAVLAGWLATARARRQLVRYQALDPRLARDIGLTPSDLSAPFWVPLRRGGEGED